MKDNHITFKGKKLFITICEDIWAWPDKNGLSIYKNNPLINSKSKKTDLVINLSASPYYPNKIKRRIELVANTAKLFKAPMVYCNLVGAQDEIIFDGSSFALDAKGNKIAQCFSFEEDIAIFDTQKMQGTKNYIKTSHIEEIRKALVLGIRDFCNKTNLPRVHIGLSGGIDSAVVACLAVDALGSSSVKLFGLPTKFNSPESTSLAKALAKNLHAEFTTINIDQLYEGFKGVVDSALNISEFSTTHENLQARIRGTMLMAYANAKNSLLLSTGNKSEYATGYSTLYGDMCGGLSPIGDLTKKQVYELARLYK